MSTVPKPLLRPPLAVRIPGSTSNLGPGFDSLGLALPLWLEVELEGPTGAMACELGATRGEAADWPRAENLLLCAFERAARRVGVEPSGWRFHAHSEIPVARGLGSSGAAVAAGLLLACALASERLALEELCALGAELEGHPDNVAASLCGGCTLSVPVGSKVAVVRQELHPSLAFAVAWPRAAVATKTARAVLPAMIPFADAAENPRRLALLLEGLRRADPELLALGGEDRLHVRHRLPLIPGGARALALAREAGAFLATVSGSGSALVAIAPESLAPAVAAALSRGLEGEGTQSRVLRPVCEPPEVRSAGIR